jgi:hypothetical protein
MPAVVDEEVNLSNLFEQLRKPPPARSFDVGPAMTQPVSDRCPDLRVEVWMQWGREVNAPEVASSISLKRFKDNPRSKAASNARLHNIGGL